MELLSEGAGVTSGGSLKHVVRSREYIHVSEFNSIPVNKYCERDDSVIVLIAFLIQKRQSTFYQSQFSLPEKRLIDLNNARFR